MDTKEIIEGNKLIAQFMGGKINVDGMDNWCKVEHDGRMFIYASSLQYHTSWDWLMPVLEKIERLDYQFEVAPYYCLFTEGTPQCDGGKCFKVISEVENHIGLFNKEMVYELVLQFIQWYNTTKK